MEGFQTFVRNFVIGGDFKRLSIVLYRDAVRHVPNKPNLFTCTSYSGLCSFSVLLMFQVENTLINILFSHESHLPHVQGSTKYSQIQKVVI